MTRRNSGHRVPALARVCTVIAVLLLAIFSAAAPHAQQQGVGKQKLGALTVEAPWARASAGAAKAGAAYLRIANAGTEDDRLVRVSAPVAERVELHTHTMSDGVTRMRKVDSVSIPGGKSAALKPGGHHVMLIGLRAPLKKGETFPLTLTFDKAGTITVTVAVGSIAARGPAMKHHDHK